MMTLQKETRDDAKETCPEGSSENSEHRVSQHFPGIVKALKKVLCNIMDSILPQQPLTPWLLHKQPQRQPQPLRPPPQRRRHSARRRRRCPVCCCRRRGSYPTLLRLLAKRQHDVTLEAARQWTSSDAGPRTRGQCLRSNWKVVLFLFVCFCNCFQLFTFQLSRLLLLFTSF